MLDRESAGQEGPGRHEGPEARGDDDLAAAVDEGASTGSHPVVESGFDTDLPDDADDVVAGAAEPIGSPRVGSDERVVKGKRRRGFWSRFRRHPRRHPPGG